MSFITRVQIKNYRSIAACDVELGSLMFLVGQNGSGKSNFLDALRFVADSLRTSLDHAMRDRGGINEVRRRSSGHPTHFGIRLDFEVGRTKGHYTFEIGAMPKGSYSIRREQCHFGEHSYDVVAGEVRESTMAGRPAAVSDRLYLVSVSGVPAFRPLFDRLSGMGFYNLNPEQIRDLQPPDAGVLLARDGRNLASVLGHIATSDPAMKDRIVEYLGQVAPGIEDAERKGIGPKETLEFRQAVLGSPSPWRFLASSMSDGTLRALAIIVSLFQAGNGSSSRVPLVGIEEPETALHPAAVGALLDALIEASHVRQVVVTSHSPELLHSDKIQAESVLAVISEGGASKISPLSQGNQSVLRNHLSSAGELLRLNQLEPDLRLFEARTRQLRLF